jgi:hypothetical protein
MPVLGGKYAESFPHSRRIHARRRPHQLRFGSWSSGGVGASSGGSGMGAADLICSGAFAWGRGRHLFIPNPNPSFILMVFCKSVRKSHKNRGLSGLSGLVADNQVFRLDHTWSNLDQLDQTLVYLIPYGRTILV